MPWYSQTFPRGSSHGYTIVIFAKYYNLTSTLDLVHGIRNQVLAVETFIRNFQLKLLDDIVFTNKRLAKIGYVPHDTCTFCKEETETIYHLFYECPFTLLFWENFEKFWFVLSGKKEKFTLQDVYIGKLEKSCELLNYLMVLAKLHIWQSRKQDKIPECEVFLKQVDVKYRTEKYIAS